MQILEGFRGRDTAARTLGVQGDVLAAPAWSSLVASGTPPLPVVSDVRGRTSRTVSNAEPHVLIVTICVDGAVKRK